MVPPGIEWVTSPYVKGGMVWKYSLGEKIPTRKPDEPLIYLLIEDKTGEKGVFKGMDLGQKTINDFGKQWEYYKDINGFFGSIDLFQDIVYPFLRSDQLKGCRVDEIGSGSGRIVNMLIEAGADHVVAIEPSEAFRILCNNVKEPEKVTFLKMTGDQLPEYGDLDYVFAIGVLHHIPNPKPVVEAAYKALKPGGHFLVWLYGKEGNNLYLTIVNPLRKITRRLPHLFLLALVWIIYFPASLYSKLCKIFPLNLHEYMIYVFGKMSPEKQRLIIYDQLNPAYAKYYTREEAMRLLEDGGFVDVKIHHRHGYSWTVIGTKP